MRKKAARSRTFPLSFSQQRLWLLEQLDPGNPVYSIPLAMRLSGALDVAALGRTLNELMARHESLRTRLPELERSYLDDVMATRDAGEGIRAFLEKRRPQWADA